MLRTRELLAEPSLRKRSGTYLPKYLRIPNALRLDGQNPQGAGRTLYAACSTRVCLGVLHFLLSVTFIIEPINIVY